MDGCVTRFGQVEFDAARGRLSVASRRVELDRACLAIFSVLLSEAGKDIDKDRLLEAGWPGRMVHENSLAKAIVRLRQALGEDARALETVHGYGYRLAVDPEHVGASEPERVPGPRRPRRAALALAAVGLIGLVVLGAHSAQERRLIKGEPADAIGRVLWVDDHPQNNAEERRFLESRKIAVYQVTSSKDALALLAMYEYDAVISDMNRNDNPLAGLELVKEMRGRNDDTPFFVYTVVPSAAQYTLVSEAGGQSATVTSDELYAAIMPIFGKGGAQGAQ
ncbi:response regulator [Sphingomonas gilva]|uniref:Response regulator n=1 Tax=Sphingomonas gilva TaxID=2305907 RepID=A0A396RUK3_9SPHN|nr:response regulator [Sphingomonas gilva]RHW18103.1 response regulator [Sphingomonas gilva]